MNGMTLRPKEKRYPARYVDLYARFDEAMNKIEKTYGQILRVAIEDPRARKVPQQPAEDVKKLWWATAMMWTYWLELCFEPVLVDKGTTPKGQADLLAVNYRLTSCSQHARDALLIGFLAGFGAK